jgi:hypothetical protein
MLRLYRKPERGEFFVVFGDTAQGGADKNFVQFLSTTRLDIPLVLAMHGVAAEMTPHLIQALTWIKQCTGVTPTVALERQNGGASAMHDLYTANTEGAYKLYVAKSTGKKEGEQQTDKLGWDTNLATRPMMLGEWLTVFESKQVMIYDKETIEQHQTFIVNKNGKPEAAPNTHDDGVISCAGVWQMYQTERAPQSRATPKRKRQFDEITGRALS